MADLQEAGLFAAAFAVAVPFAGRTRRQGAELDRTAEQFREAFGEGSARMLTAPGRNIR